MGREIVALGTTFADKLDVFHKLLKDAEWTDEDFDNAIKTDPEFKEISDQVEKLGDRLGI